MKYFTICSVFPQIQSGLGKLIMKEENEKEQIREGHARSQSAQRYESQQNNYDGGMF